jgi:CBS domain containing-hemolysin-like protein
MSAFFSSSEIVFTAVNPIRLENDVKHGNKRAKKALRLVEKFNQSISTILLGNNIANIAASSMATLIFLTMFEATIGEQNAALLASIVMFVFVVTFGEIIPKILGKKFSYRLALLTYPIVNFFRILFAPVVFLITLAFKAFDPIIKKRLVDEPMTEDELVEMVDTIEAEGLIDEKQGDLLRSTIMFADTAAFEAMTPRVDVLSFNIEDDITELLDDPETFTYSRIPVYEETIDNIIGVLPTKYLYPYLLNKESVDIRSLLVEPLFVPHGKTISSILKIFKDTHQHIAIVIDEYGGTEGIITMEDIIEEIVGEIWDENDEVQEPIVKLNDTTFIVDGSMHIEDFFEEFEVEEEEESDYATVGGWCQEHLERFGVVGDQFDYFHLHITVTQADEFTIEKIRVEVRPRLDED